MNKAPDTVMVVDDPHVRGKVNTKLALLAALAVGIQAMPQSAARDLLHHPVVVRRAGRGEPEPFVPPAQRKPNTNGLNRKTRRRIASMAAHGKLGKVTK